MCNFFNVLLVPKRDIWKRSDVAQHRRGGGPDVTVRPRGTGGSPAPRRRISRRRVSMWLRPRAPTARAQPQPSAVGAILSPAHRPGSPRGLLRAAPSPPPHPVLQPAPSAPSSPCPPGYPVPSPSARELLWDQTPFVPSGHCGVVSLFILRFPVSFSRKAF